MLRHVLLSTIALFVPAIRRPGPDLVQEPPALPPPAAIVVPAPVAKPLLRINSHEAILRFSEYMRAWGFVGWMLPEDVDEAYFMFCDEEGLEPMNLLVLRELFAKAPGVVRERKRLRNTADKKLLQCRTRSGQDRPWLYRVASLDEMQVRAQHAKRAAAAKRRRIAPITLTTELPMKRAA